MKFPPANKFSRTQIKTVKGKDFHNAFMPQVGIEKKPVLIIFHQASSDAGAVGQWLLKNNYPLDIRRPRFSDPLPETLSEHSGAVVFGGPMSANDKDNFVQREINWLSVPLKENKPFLGICLGAQMLVKQLGGQVFSHRENRVEVGHYPIFPTEQGQKISSSWPSHFYQFHTEGFDLPSGTTCLAKAEDFENQAFQHGRSAFGLQFHPEVTLAMVHRWTIRGADRLTLKGALNRRAHLQGHYKYAEGIRNWLDTFLHAWITPRTH